MDPIEARIIKEVGKSEEGLSIWDIRKMLGISRDVSRYRMEKMRDIGVFVKDGSKYKINKEEIEKLSVVGGALMINRNEGIDFVECPHYKIDCTCGELVENCKLIKELPEEMKERVLNKMEGQKIEKVEY